MSPFERAKDARGWLRAAQEWERVGRHGYQRARDCYRKAEACADAAEAGFRELGAAVDQQHDDTHAVWRVEAPVDGG
jgi:hypothetical protein